MNSGTVISLFLFITLVFLSSANHALFTPHEIHLAHEFRTSILAIDFIMFLFTAVPALFLPLWGFLCDKAEKGGRKNLLLVGAALWSISSLIICYAPSYSLLLVARIITGIGIVVIYPVGFSMVTDFISPQKRGKAFASIAITIALGTGAGIVLASAFGEFAWRPPFLVMGIIGLLILVLSFLFFREPGRGEAEPELRELIRAGKNYIHKIDLQKFMKTLRIGTNHWLLLSKILWRLPLGIYAYKYIPYLEMYGFGPGVKTMVTLLVGSGAVFGYFLGGLIGDWANKLSAGRISVSVLSLFFGVMFLSMALLIPRSEVLWSFNLIFFFLFSFLGVVLTFINVPNLDAIVGDVNEPETRGMFISIISSLGWLSFGAGVLIGGIWAEANLVSYKGILLWEP